MTIGTYKFSMSQSGAVRGKESSRKRKQRVQMFRYQKHKGMVWLEGGGRRCGDKRCGWRLEVEIHLAGIRKMESISFQLQPEATKWYSAESDQKFYILKDSPGCGLDNELWGGSQELRLRGPLG